MKDAPKTARGRTPDARTRPDSAGATRHRARRLTPWGRVAVALLVTLAATAKAQAAPFKPSSDSQVLERVRVNLNDPFAARLREYRQKLQLDPRNVRLAASLARAYIERGRQESDPRYTGRAQAVLAPWWALENPPAPVLVLRATIRQSQHQFPQAKADLERALKLDRQDPQAWVTLATVQGVTGDLEAAKRSCVPLLTLSTELVGVTCVAGVSSANGQAGRAYEVTRDTLAKFPKSSTAEQLWALTTMAEAASRAGRDLEAEVAFKRALALGEPDVYLTAAYSDFLLERNRVREVVSLIGTNTRPDALLLRLILAEKALGSPNRERRVREMAARIEANRLRGDVVHRREEAIFALHVKGNAKEALELSTANFAVQREPTDVRLLLESAVAARQPSAARGALEFLRQSKLEGKTIAGLARQLEGSLK